MSSYDGLIERIRNNEDYQAIADLYYTINASFVLNPSGNPDLADMTQIDWVRLRKPKYLLVNIGVNDGLFMALLTGDLAAYRSLISGIPDKIRRLAPWLRDAITATEGICFNSLIKPRAVGNLSPIEDPHNPHINNDYFYSYKSALYSPGPTMARQDMEDLDILVREVNRKVRDILVQALGNNQKLHFVDVYNAAAMYDFKHGTSGRRVDVMYKGKPIHISNLVFSTVGSAYKQGGFFSLDNLHPTSVGYAVLANAVLADMVPAAAGRTPPMVDFQAALDADPLFNNPPPNLEGLSCFFNLVMAIVGAFGLATV